MENLDNLKGEALSKGNSEDSLLVIYILRILKKYSSSEKPLSSQEVMEYLKQDYSIGSSDKVDAQRKKVRRHLDTLHESYWNGCIEKVEGKTRTGHKWYYDVSKDKLADKEGAVYETLSKEEINFLIDIITSSKIINTESTSSIVKKLLDKIKDSEEENDSRLREIEDEQWSKSINKDLVLMKQEIESCIDDWRKIKFDYEQKKMIIVTPYGWDADDTGKYILIAKVKGSPQGKFDFFDLDKIHHLQKMDFDYDDWDDTYFDKVYAEPDALSMESLFSNIRIITDAIEEEIGVVFKYLTYVIADNKVDVEGKDKRVLPHRLVFNEGKYYLIGYDEEDSKIDYYRVDLISKLELSDTKIKISDWNARVLTGVERAREVEKHPLMLAGKDIPVTFKVAESALDRVIDAFAVKPDKFVITSEKRSVRDACGEDFHDERIVKIQVRTTLEEAFRWSLANAEVVEIETQEIRDRIARIAEPIHQLYTQTLPDKVRENLDQVLKTGKFQMSSDIDEETAYATYKELSKRGKLGAVSSIIIGGWRDYNLGDYLGEFINTKYLSLAIDNLKNTSWLSKLVNLETLKFLGVNVNDASWMKEMKKLRSIYLAECPISDLSVLNEHTEIDWMDISNTKVSDISFIEKYQNLTYLNIVMCPIKDYSPLLKTQSHPNTLEIDIKGLDKIGKDKLKERHFYMTILPRPNNPLWRFLV